MRLPLLPLNLGSLGNNRTESLRAFSADDLVHALRNAATRINALANELANARDTVDAA
jgi:hypothetical protein